MIEKVIEYIHRPNVTEVGVGTNTNDCYLKLSTAVENSEMFKKNKEEQFYNAETDSFVLLKAVKYDTPSNSEYRLTKLGAVRKVLNIECGDELVFRREIGIESAPIFELHKFNKVMFYPHNKKCYSVLYANKISGWNPRGSNHLDVFYKGNSHALHIDFLFDKKKRSDSPNTTPLYSLSVEYLTLPSKTYCLFYVKNQTILKEYDKWELNEITL